jgi:chemotaxis protein CheD
MQRDHASQKIVEIGGLIVTNNPNDVIVTYSLGSCVGVTLYDPVNKIGGMIHCMLPLSSTDKDKALKNPSMFVDTGMMKFIQDLADMGANKKDLICKVAGAGSPLQDSGLFRIGERNHAILKKILWKNSILVKGELIGDKTAKTMYLHMDTGITYVRINGKEENEL